MCACPARFAKIFLFTKNGNCDWMRSSRLVKRDVTADRRQREAGCDGREGCETIAVRRVRSSRVVLAPRRWRQVRGRVHGRRWLTSPAHRGEHGAAVNTITQGMPVV